MKQITEFCTGCRVCEQLCAKKAISMVADKEGFLIAKVDSGKCVDCGLCQNKCPQNALLTRNAPKKVLVVRLKDDEVLFRSASGGAFGGIAEAWIKDGGVVFGFWKAIHIESVVINVGIVDQNGLGILQLVNFGA